MDKKLKENIQFLINDKDKFERVSVSILFSFQRNYFFTYLSNYIKLYNEVKGKLKSHYSTNDKMSNSINAIPDLHFENYALDIVTQFALMASIPLTFPIFILQWNYIKKIKKKIKLGLIGFEELVRNC